MSIFKSERELIEEQLLNIMGRHIDLKSEENKWLFTIGHITFGASEYIPEWSREAIVVSRVSHDKELAIVVNTFNALHERNWLINYKGMTHKKEKKQEQK